MGYYLHSPAPGKTSVLSLPYMNIQKSSQLQMQIEKSSGIKVDIYTKRASPTLEWILLGKFGASIATRNSSETACIELPLGIRRLYLAATKMATKSSTSLAEPQSPLGNLRMDTAANNLVPQSLSESPTSRAASPRLERRLSPWSGPRLGIPHGNTAVAIRVAVSNIKVVHTECPPVGQFGELRT
eukprot:GHVR01127444.1.p1 GENE.GHVR01127444.1~~GHVR01127444.1.p1  ORF type:complete len:185 (-),score=13.21 GHVR01127444.1:138-692(-)